MKKYFIFLTLIVLSLGMGVISGFLIVEKRFFPYKHIQKAYSTLGSQVSPWSVGIYEGDTPFDLSDPVSISNPVLTKKDITDVDALFIADPFIVINDEKQTLFFEVFNKETNQGDIGYAESNDGINWEYKKIVIDEPFHLSYPHVFKWNDDYYLIPESGEDLCVRLYKATSFPDKWTFVGTLIAGHNFIDPSIFYYKNKWWLFTSTDKGVLNLHYSDDLFNGWRAHPKNPIVKSNKNIARPAGRVFMYNGNPHRLAQSGIPRYGSQVFAFEIIELSESIYEERKASEEPIVTFSGNGWNAGRMHHVDLHKVGDRWVGSVDGRSK